MPNSLKCKIKHLCHNRTLTKSECDRLLKALEQREKIEQLLELYQDALARLRERQRNNINDAIVDAMFSGKLSVYGIVIADLKSLLDESEEEAEPCEVTWVTNNKGEGVAFKNMPIEKVNKILAIIDDEPCEDAVSRQAVLEITAETGALETQARVKALPPVTQEPKTGHWIMIDKELQRYICSECGEVIKLYKKSEISKLEKDETLSDYPFSHCGAKMVEP